MISPDYVWATGIPTQHSSWSTQLGSNSPAWAASPQLYYGVKSSIVFGNKHVEEYFNVANINHYDVILGTPFLRRLGITLDFTSQGIICIGMYVIPMNVPSEPSDDVQRPVMSKPLKPQPKPPELSQEAALLNARQHDTQCNRLPTIHLGSCMVG